MARVEYDSNADNVIARILNDTWHGMVAAAEHVLQVSNERVPLDQSPLMQSGTVTEDRGEMTVAISYDTPYAVKQHEDLTLQHLNGREAKYLENSANEEADTVQRIIATAARRATRG